MAEIKTLSSKIVYENKWMRVREDKIQPPSGAEGMFGVVKNRINCRTDALCRAPISSVWLFKPGLPYLSGDGFITAAQLAGPGGGRLDRQVIYARTI